MCQLRSASLHQEGPEVFFAFIVQLLLLKTQTPKHPCPIGEMVFPIFDFKNLLINIPISFPFLPPIDPMIRIEILCWNPNQDEHHNQMDDGPGHEIDDNRQEGGKIDEPHKSNFPPSLS